MEPLIVSFNSMLPASARQTLLAFQESIVRNTGVSNEMAQLVPFLIILVVTIMFIVFIGGVQGKSKRKLGDSLVLLGPCDSGKTALFYKLLGGKVPETVTSMEIHEKTFSFHEKAEIETTVAVNVIDIPGHGRLRTSIGPYLKRARVLVYMINSCNLKESKSITDCAELLYEVFVQCYKEDCRPDVLIACNKSDRKDALNPKEVCEILQKEIDQLKETRNAIAVEGTEDEEEVVIGVDGQKFDFEVDAPCEVSFCACSVTGSDLGDVKDFIEDAFIKKS